MTGFTFFGIVTVGAVDPDISLVILVIGFLDLRCLFVMAISTAFSTFQPFHVRPAFAPVMASDTRFSHVFTDMEFVIEGDKAVIRVKFHIIRQRRSHMAGFFKCKTLTDMAGVAAYIHILRFMASHTVGSHEAGVGWIITLHFSSLSEVMAGTAVHLDQTIFTLFIVVMAVNAFGQFRMVGVIEDDVPSRRTQPHSWRGGGGPGKGVSHKGNNKAYDQENTGKDFLCAIKHNGHP